MSKTAAQEEFDDFLAKNTGGHDDDVHPEDRHDAAHERELHDRDNSDEEEEEYRAAQIDAAMRMPGNDRPVQLPPASFDAGRATGVKGVIADARNFENAKKSSKWSEKMRNARRSVIGLTSMITTSDAKSNDSDEHSSEEDDESFLRQWRESRRRELESEDRSNVRNRRTSPSVRTYGRLEEVDAMGYLDAIEKVSRETNVVVFVYDPESEVCSVIESALKPLVMQHPTTRFVKIHHEEIEFDNAGVPAVLAYRNQGDLFANLTAIIDLIPDDEEFDSNTLENLFQKHDIL
ncbi:phosducin [Coniella lustricola]|uniref:Phosducin n=1 Tax=Coniella lustricola TaxID=2025994 RepID=A0A2T3AEM3_9PEZI|nr:phosducin [Coniella lustricola]